MRRLSPFGLILSAAVATLFVAQLATSGAHQPARPASWEHLALTQNSADTDQDLSNRIVKLGQQGWELVGVAPIAEEGTTTKTIYYFKRPG